MCSKAIFKSEFQYWKGKCWSMFRLYFLVFFSHHIFSAHFLHLTLSRTLELKILELFVQQQNKHYYISLGVPCAVSNQLMQPYHLWRKFIRAFPFFLNRHNSWYKANKIIVAWLEAVWGEGERSLSLTWRGGRRHVWA